MFIVYPEGLATVPASQLFSVLFFLMLVCLAIDSQVSQLKLSANVNITFYTVDLYSDHVKG